MCLQCKQKQLLNVVTRWPGSTHDAHIWNNCNLSLAFESGQIHNEWLLGDSAYGITPWLGRGIILSMHLLWKPAVANPTLKFLIGDKVRPL
jgi:hypothetical protein